MINIHAQSDRIQVFFWDLVISSLSKVRSLRTYQQQASAPALRLQRTTLSYAPKPVTRIWPSARARLFILQLAIISLFGFLAGFLYGWLH